MAISIGTSNLIYHTTHCTAGVPTYCLENLTLVVDDVRGLLAVGRAVDDSNDLNEHHFPIVIELLMCTSAEVEVESDNATKT